MRVARELTALEALGHRYLPKLDWECLSIYLQKSILRECLHQHRRENPGVLFETEFGGWVPDLETLDANASQIASELFHRRQLRTAKKFIEADQVKLMLILGSVEIADLSDGTLYFYACVKDDLEKVKQGRFSAHKVK